MRPPTTMRTVTARQLGWDNEARPLGDLQADVQDQKANKRLTELLTTVPALRTQALALKENGYPPAAIVEELLRLR
jgi:hypothetical protein